ncbi:hypothetical protein C8R47DRAFT_1142851, partial [Mycena vitilis]
MTTRTMTDRRNRARTRQSPSSHIPSLLLSLFIMLCAMVPMLQATPNEQLPYTKSRQLPQRLRLPPIYCPRAPR